MRAALNSERGRQVSDEVSRAGLLRTCRAWQRALRAARRGDGQGSMPPMAPLARRIRLGASITIPGIPTPTPRRRPAQSLPERTSSAMSPQWRYVPGHWER